jgi:hypothetical protein
VPIQPTGVVGGPIFRRSSWVSSGRGRGYGGPGQPSPGVVGHRACGDSNRAGVSTVVEAGSGGARPQRGPASRLPPR